MFEEIEAELRDEEEQTASDNIENAPEDSSTCQKWSRPPLKSLDPEVDTVTFQQLDVDYYRVSFRLVLCTVH